MTKRWRREERESGKFLGLDNGREFSTRSAMSFKPLVIAGREFRSRLILGTGKFPSPEAMRDALAARI